MFGTLDEPTAVRVGPVLAWLRERVGGDDPTVSLLEEFFLRALPSGWPGGAHEHHETAWALGDLFEQAGLAEHAALCRSKVTHERLALRHWVARFPGVPAEFWAPALSALDQPVELPARVGLSMASAQAVLETVGRGLRLTTAGRLPPKVVQALDDRFRWSEEFPWMRPPGSPYVGESAIAPLSFLHDHLTAQRLLVRNGRRLSRSAEGDACVGDPGRLWRALVAPAPRWTHDFELDALGVLTAAVLRSDTFTPGRIAEEMTHVLAGKWEPAAHDSVFEGAALVAQEWYRVGVPLGWWDTGRGPADRRPNDFGRVAAASVFRAVGARPVG